MLYGHNPDEGIVAVHLTDDASMTLTVRTNGRTVTQVEPFYPFFYLADPDLLQGFPHKHWVRQIAGSHPLSHLCAFEGWSNLWDAVRHVLVRYNQKTPVTVETYNQLDGLYLITDPVTQFLVQTGHTLFKGMTFDQIHRMQLDIETYTAGTHRFSSPARAGDRIILIALSDNRGWEHIIDGRHHDEAHMLTELVRVIRDRDPDVIEGHNILGFDLPYIARRCAIHDVEFRIGRDNSTLRLAESRTARTDQGPDILAADCAGRHIVDTLSLVQSYDAVKRNMESHGLKYAARYFGLRSPDRVEIEGERISWTWDNDPETLARYALDDVRETGRLAEHLLPASFYLACIVPCAFGPLTRMGAAAKIELLLVREYLHQKHSLPQPASGEQTTGGYTDLFVSGVLGPIIHADVESLYPSLMIANTIAPRSDSLGVFTAILRELTTRRLALKKEMRATADEVARSRIDAMQSSLKILINSFYGYLGYSRGLFNDFRKADEVTQAGQDVLRGLIGTLRSAESRVIEVDTDGVYCVPPPDVNGAEAEEAFVATVGRSLPAGLTLALDGRYRRMMSYKKKNYALLGYDDRMLLKGSSLISRSMERFGRTYVRLCIERILTNDIEGLHRVYMSVAETIQAHAMDVRDFARVETIRDPLEEYQEAAARGKRNRSAVYEVVLRYALTARPGDKVAYYVTGSDPNVRTFEECKPAELWDPNFPDENTAYYMRRLAEFSSKFEILFRPGDFARIFAADDLFPFSAEGIIIQNRTLEGLQEAPDDPVPQPGIWLDE